MKTKLNNFMQTHLKKWLAKNHKKQSAAYLSLIDSFLCDMAESELLYWLRTGWEETLQVALEERREVKGILLMPRWWNQWGNGAKPRRKIS